MVEVVSGWILPAVGLAVCLHARLASIRATTRDTAVSVAVVISIAVGDAVQPETTSATHLMESDGGAL